MLIVADNLQITEPMIGKAVSELNPEPIQKLVLKMEAAGAEAIDINSGPLTREPEKRMTFLVDAVTAVTDLPILLDTTNPQAIEAGLTKCLNANKNKPIINGFSLEPKKLKTILPLAATYEVDIIGYLLDKNSQVPRTLDERFAIAIELLGVLEHAGVAREQLILDPVAAPLMWENGKVQNQHLLRILLQLPDLLGFPVRTIAGISNLTTGTGPKNKKRHIEETYLPMLAGAGLHMALLNVDHADAVKIAKTCTTLLSPDVFSWEMIVS